jgi:hypothetical protein
MSYTTVNFKTKKALKEAVAAGLTGAKTAVTMQREPMSGKIPTGTVYLEGPHYPAPHTWYAQVEVNVYGVVTKVK